MTPVRALLTLASSLALAPALVAAQSLKNPLAPGFDTIPLFIAGALKVLVMVALPIITLFIVYSGFKFVAAQGSESKLTEAKHNFMYVILGSLLILGAWIIATLIGGTVDQLTRGI
jgi:hypothetical protein